MSAATLAAAGAQVGGGLLLAPLLPGLVQHWKARLQGRRGPTPLFHASRRATLAFPGQAQAQARERVQAA